MATAPIQQQEKEKSDASSATKGRRGSAAAPPSPSATATATVAAPSPPWGLPGKLSFSAAVASSRPPPPPPLPLPHRTPPASSSRQHPQPPSLQHQQRNNTGGRGVLQLRGDVLPSATSSSYRAKLKRLFPNVDPQSRALLLLDDVALYSTTDQPTADEMTRALLPYVPRKAVVVDATASAAAGNTISLARTFAGVVAIESNRARYELLRHNVSVLGLSTKVKCVYADAVHLLLDPASSTATTASSSVVSEAEAAAENNCHPPLTVQTKNCAANLIRLPATSQAQAQAQARAAVDELRRSLPWPLDAVFIDPPWGGPRYRQADSLSLTLSRVPLEVLLVEMAQRRAARCVALKVPQNFDMDGFVAAIDASAESGNSGNSDNSCAITREERSRRYVLAEERDFKSMRMLVLVLEEGDELQTSPRLQMKTRTNVDVGTNKA